MDQSKKTMRHFYCRDVLWETFEQMANDFDCSIDYLINEAMRYYARSKNYQSPATSGVGPAEGGPRERPEQPERGGRPVAPTNVPPTASGAGLPPRRPAPTTQPPAVPPTQRRPAGPTPAVTPSAMPMSARQGHPPTPAGYGQPMAGGYGAPQSGGYAAPQAYGQAPSTSPPAAMAQGSTLFLIYNSQRYAVNKDQFIIGRGSKTSDLAIKDGNISRKHAAVIRRNGTYYIKDLGSTNGIDYKGMRIDNKRIDEGDIFHMCDYEIRFTYRSE